MQRILAKLFRGRSQSSNMRKAKLQFRPQLEGLETRLVPAIFMLENGVMNVIGTSQADTITIQEESIFQGYDFYQSSWGWYAVPRYDDEIVATIKDSAGNVVEEDGFLADDVAKISVLGQSGNDLINNYTDKISEINGQNGNDTIYGGFSADTLRGGDGNDTIYGRDGNDRIHFDHIYGDNDYANGGSHNDTYVVDARPYSSAAGQRMRISDSYGVNTLDFSAYQSGIDLDMWNSAEQQVAYSLYLDTNHSSAIRNVIGTNSSDNIVGSAYHNVIETLNGNDTLEGMQGNDTLRGGGGSDTYRFWTDANLGSQYSNTMNLGDDRVEDNATSGSTGTNDTLNFIFFTRSGIDIDIASTATQSVGTGLTIDLSSNVAIRNIDGSKQGDEILGNNLNNTLNGWEGSDYIRGRNGSDTLNGWDGNDTLAGGNGRDFVFGGSGNDVLYSDESWGDDDGENDHVDGGSGTDSGSDDGWPIWW